MGLIFWLKFSRSDRKFPKTYSYEYAIIVPPDSLKERAIWPLRPQADQKDVTMGDVKKLVHMKWSCKCHMAFFQNGTEENAICKRDAGGRESVQPNRNVVLNGAICYLRWYPG